MSEQADDGWDNAEDSGEEDLDLSRFDLSFDNLGDPANSFIPEEHEQRLNQILKEMEERTGLKFQISVHQFGNSKPLIIGDFGKRGPIEVSETKSEYTKLEGQYEDIDALKTRFKELHYQDVFDETKQTKIKGEYVRIGKCCKCHSYNDSVSPTRIDEIMCRGCCTILTSKWKELEIKSELGEIVKAEDAEDGGFWITTVAKFNFI